VETLRRWHDAWNRGDLDTFADLFHPDAEVIPDPSWMEPGPFRGRTAIRRWYEGLRESWDGRDEAVVRELFEASGQVVSRFDWEVRGRASGIDTRLDLTAVNLVREGRIVRQQYFFDYAEALKSVGLAEQAISQENVEIVRRLLEAVNCRDFDAMLETGDPEIEIVTLMTGTYRRHAGWRQLVEQMAEELSGFQFVPEDFIDVGQDRVVAVTRWVGAGRTSGIAVPDTTIGLVYTLRDGLVVRQESFRNRAEALKAVGLAE
jgi:ketosteroid isomerase-like protein